MDGSSELSDKGLFFTPEQRQIPASRFPYFDYESRWIAAFDYQPDKITIYDPVWNKCEIGDQEGDEVLLELVDNSLVRRSLNVEQLTLDRLTATIPATAEFSRFEHIWGGVVLTRKMLEKSDVPLDSRAKLVLQLRAFVSDLGHTSGSHRGDWLFQGMGGPEDQHDNELMRLLEMSGINDTLRKHGIGPEEVVFPDTEDWVEKPAPDLCVDRVDYAAREMKRWLNMRAQIEFATRPDAFTVIDNNLVMTEYNHAINFAKAFLLLPTEHWCEPVHRLQLYFDQELVKRIFTADGPGLIASHDDGRDPYHPRDYLYTVDRDVTMEMGFRDPFLNSVRPLMEDIAVSKRRSFAWERAGQLDHFFFEGAAKFPDPLEPYEYSKDYSMNLIPGNLHIIPVDDPHEVEDYQQNPASLDVFLPPFKPRAIDPLFLTADNEVKRLSQVDENYASLMKQQADILGRAYLARVYLNPVARQKIMDGLAENARLWPEALERPRMEADRFRKLLDEVANYAINGSFVVLEGQSLFR